MIESSLARFVRGLLSAKVRNSSLAEVRMGLFSEQPTWKMKMKMEVRRMKRKMRGTVKSAEWRVEEYQDNNNMRMIHEMTCAQDTLNQCHVRH